MAKIKCFHCKHEWPLAGAETNRCPKCNWVTELYFDKQEAEEVVRIYNEHEPALSPEGRVGLEPVVEMNAYSVSFPDQQRLADVAGLLLDLGR